MALSDHVMLLGLMLSIVLLVSTVARYMELYETYGDEIEKMDHKKVANAHFFITGTRILEVITALYAWKIIQLAFSL